MVNNLSEFIAKYGRRGEKANAMLQKFILAAPEFPGDVEMAKDLGMLMADLESALVNSK